VFAVFFSLHKFFWRLVGLCISRGESSQAPARCIRFFFLLSLDFGRAVPSSLRLLSFVKRNFFLWFFGGVFLFGFLLFVVFFGGGVGAFFLCWGGVVGLFVPLLVLAAFPLFICFSSLLYFLPCHRSVTCPSSPLPNRVPSLIIGTQCGSPSTSVVPFAFSSVIPFSFRLFHLWSVDFHRTGLLLPLIG